jgi:cell division protein FtsB
VTLKTRQRAEQIAKRPEETSGLYRAPRVRWLKLRYLAPVVIGGWAAYYYLHTLHPQLLALQQQHQALTQQLTTLRRQHDQLAQEARNLQSDAYVAKYASEHFNLVLPGQVPFVVH